MKRGVILTIAAGVGALVVGGAAVAWMLTRPPSIEDAARAYLDALATGDLVTIDDMRADRLDDTAERAIADAFGQATSYATMGELTDVDGGTVSARAVIGEDTVTLRFDLALQDDRWLLESGYLTPVTVTSPWGDAAWIGGALIDLQAAVPLLPAEYEVVPAPRGILEGAVGVVVADEAMDVELPAVVSPEAAARAQEQLDVYAAACASPAAAVPTHCGVRVPWAADLVTLNALTFRIETYPSVALDVDNGEFEATGGVLVATAAGTARDGGAGSFTYRADDWSLYGEVSFVGDEMRLSVR